MRATSESLTLNGPDGQLEARLDLPPGFDGTRVAVICHPHPMFGGTMDNKVVYTLMRSMHDLNTATLRFNFRGVGKSAGKFDEGQGETDDCLAAVSAMREKYPDAELCLAGFSFGGYVALRACETVAPNLLVTVAPAVRWFAGADKIKPDCDWLLLQGGADDVVEAQGVYSWLEERALTPIIKEFSGVGHFFHGSLTELRQTVVGNAGIWK